jgi:hypothetical protein
MLTLSLVHIADDSKGFSTAFDSIFESLEQWANFLSPFGVLIWEMISLIVMGTQVEWHFKQLRGCGEQRCHHGDSLAKFNRVKN